MWYLMHFSRRRERFNWILRIIRIRSLLFVFLLDLDDLHPFIAWVIPGSHKTWTLSRLVTYIRFEHLVLVLYTDQSRGHSSIRPWSRRIRRREKLALAHNLSFRFKLTRTTKRVQFNKCFGPPRRKHIFFLKLSISGSNVKHKNIKSKLDPEFRNCALIVIVYQKFIRTHPAYKTW